jgi:hypothetical protein
MISGWMDTPQPKAGTVPCYRFACSRTKMAEK